MKVLIVALLAAGLYSDARPPERFQGNARYTIHTVDDANIACAKLLGIEPPKGGYFAGCYTGGVVYVDNPCKYPGEVYADILCHEQAHTLGWSRFHEE